MPDRQAGPSSLSTLRASVLQPWVLTMTLEAFSEAGTPHNSLDELRAIVQSTIVRDRACTMLARLCRNRSRRRGFDCRS